MAMALAYGNGPGTGPGFADSPRLPLTLHPSVGVLTPSPATLNFWLVWEQTRQPALA
jgi:hypothetical protein